MKICMVRCISHHMLTENCIWNGKYQLNKPFWTAWWQLPHCWMLMTFMISTDSGPGTRDYKTLSSHLNTGLTNKLISEFQSLKTEMFAREAFFPWAHPVTSTVVLVLFNSIKTICEVVQGQNKRADYSDRQSHPENTGMFWVSEAEEDSPCLVQPRGLSWLRAQAAPHQLSPSTAGIGRQGGHKEKLSVTKPIFLRKCPFAEARFSFEWT